MSDIQNEKESDEIHFLQGCDNIKGFKDWLVSKLIENPSLCETRKFK